VQAYVYKSLKKADTYAYLARHDDFDCLPEPVRKQLGELRFVLDVALVEGRKLALASQLSTAAPNAETTSEAPLGIGSVVSEGETSTSGCTLEHPATRVAASTSSAARISGTRSVVA